MSKVAILVDGGYYKACYWQRYKENPLPEDLLNHCDKLLNQKALLNYELLRIYYYDCLPYDKDDVHPVTKEKISYAETPQFEQNMKFLNELKVQPNIAFRKGILKLNGWKISSEGLRDVISQHRTIRPQDIRADFKQKRLDINIGLDIAWLASKQLADCIVLITGDTDFIPALKFARREGVKVIVNLLAPSNAEDLYEHSDLVIKLKPLL
ncbi:MAG: NYN domain-containing protein [Candidatus Margulisbacteria bacterium]|nr:NYN domain-containing protein [Candidatus Margulisiibacteriota bacterium]